MAEKADRARVAYQCKTCKAEGVIEKDVKHTDDCEKADVKARCTKSGSKPHDN